MGDLGRGSGPIYKLPVTFDGEIVWFQEHASSGFGISRARLVALLEDSAKADYPLTSEMVVLCKGGVYPSSGRYQTVSNSKEIKNGRDGR